MLDRFPGEFLALGLEIDRLAAGHADRAASAGQESDEFDASAVACRIEIGKYLKRQRLQGVRGENRRGFVERPVYGRLPAPQVVVVHGGQVVVHQ